MKTFYLNWILYIIPIPLQSMMRRLKITDWKRKTKNQLRKPMTVPLTAKNLMIPRDMTLSFLL